MQIHLLFAKKYDTTFFAIVPVRFINFSDFLPNRHKKVIILSCTTQKRDCLRSPVKVALCFLALKQGYLSYLSANDYLASAD